jgi:hypothetical protein
MGKLLMVSDFWVTPPLSEELVIVCGWLSIARI